MSTRTFRAKDPAALVRSVTIGDDNYVDADVRGHCNFTGFTDSESDALALASRLLGRDVTRET